MMTFFVTFACKCSFLVIIIIIIIKSYHLTMLEYCLTQINGICILVTICDALIYIGGLQVYCRWQKSTQGDNICCNNYHYFSRRSQPLYNALW